MEKWCTKHYVGQSVRIQICGVIPSWQLKETEKLVSKRFYSHSEDLLCGIFPNHHKSVRIENVEPRPI